MNSINKTKDFSSIIIIGILFFIFGFITWLNATLIPYLKIACELTSFESYFVTMAFYISYFVMAFPSSLILNKIGFKNGISLGLMIMAIGSLIFIPAAISREYGVFLIGLFIQGTGLAILQTAANPYVTIVGPIESAAKRISIMGVANKTAGILSPIILGSIVLNKIDFFDKPLNLMQQIEKENVLNELSEKVIIPYIVISIVLTALGFWVKKSKLPEVVENEQKIDVKNKLTDFPHLLIGVLALFFYVGAEVISVDTLISYGSSLGFSMQEAKFFSSFTLLAMIFGYFVGIAVIPKYISQAKALSIFSIIAIFFVLLSLITTGFISVLFIAALGFANSIMWPAIWPLSLDGVGSLVKKGSALLIMSIAGGAIIPLIYGYLSSSKLLGTQMAYAILLPLYLFILYFAIWGCKIRLTKNYEKINNK